MRTAFLLAAILTATTATAGCGSSGKGSAAPTLPPATIAPPSTVAPTTAAPTTTTLPASGDTTPDAAAADLVADWGDGSRAAAAKVATAEAITTLFAIPYPSGYLQPRGCTDPSTDPGTCTYRNTETDAIYEMGVVDAPGGWYVSTVTPET